MSANNSPVGFAIIGLGSIADFHVAAIEKAEGAKLAAVFSRSAEKCKKFAAEHDAIPCATFEELLARPDIEVVMIASPSGTHADIAIQAMKAGKHVLCEKPLDVTLEKIDAVLKVAKETNRIAAAIFQSRFGSNAQALKAAIDAGRFGKLTICSAYIKWWRTQDYYDSSNWRGTWALDGGGALMNQGIHAVDLLQWLVGMPSEISAYTATLAHEGLEVEDTAVASLRFKHGAVGVIEGSTACYPGTAKRIEIAGTDGFVILEDDNFLRWDFRNEKPGDAEMKNTTPGIIGGGAADPRAISFTGHCLQIEDMIRVIKNGGNVAIPASDARNAVQIILGIYESARKNAPVKL
ncbi:MAG: Gfo/Idh/MocA family oxidoreductase [Chthoniobacterales bacterium]